MISKFNFLGGLPMDINYLNRMKDKIMSDLVFYSKSKYGRVVEGFDISLENRKISTTAGCGFTPQGELVEISNESILIAPSHVKDVGESVIFVCTQGKGAKLSLGYFAYNGASNPDPYWYSWKDDPQYKSKLALAFIFKGRVYPINREHQIPRFPVKSISFYTRDDFKDYITLRGCRVLREAGDRFIRFSSSHASLGGETRYRLKTSHIPSLVFNGKTAEAGRHTHEYVSYHYEGAPHHFGWSYYDYVTDTKTDTFSYAGSHSHTFTTYTDNTSYPDPIDIEPEYATLVPILREY
ncbi:MULTISPECIES: hypothetical protein [unclassified Borrelia]|uniref:hypothetical protein n=2 Tax=Borrelia TaxID=138 RepID=UPI001E514EFE|nr:MULTISPECIES: hypothetical protein [unclassified Borrelia]UGQ16678.1 hypothetical protein LSO06_05005 [Borrelia sp. RT5S]UGQ17836.1 hypothetical protein LSO05_05240 [Borrelia sp. RT1S]